MKKNYFLFVVICVIFLSCNTSPRLYNPDVVMYKNIKSRIDSLQLHEVLDINADVRNLLCIDKYLIISQDNSDTLFWVVDTSEDSIIARFGRIGHASNEFSSTPEIVYCARDVDGSPLLCVLEEVCTKIIDLRKSIESNKCIMSDVIEEKKNSFFYHTYHLAGRKCFKNKIVSYNDPRDEIYFPPEFCYIDEDIKKWNIYPEIIKPQFKSSVIGDYYNTISVSPNGMYVASMNYHIDIITIFDLKEKRAIGIVNPNSYTYDFLENEINESNVNEKIRLFNTSVCATDKHYVVLEDGRTLRERGIDNERGNENVGLKVCGYDWKGNCQFAYNVDKNISYIAYDEITNKIYATDIFNGKLYNCILN